MEWLEYEATFWVLALLSIAIFIATLVIVPWLLLRIPADYFSHPRPKLARTGSGFVLALAKNTLGYFFIAIGVFMLILPGQGLLAILVGIMLANFPGKYRLERWIISRPPVWRSVNWLRRRAGRAPLIAIT